jgi:hypothetical protein
MAEEELTGLQLKSVGMDKNNKRSYRFKSLGIIDPDTEIYSESTLFPIGTEVTIQSGKFPLTDHTDMGKIYTIGNKEVILDGFTHDCTGSPVVNGCEIVVKPPPGPIAGGRRRRKTKKAHRRRRSSRKRTTR